MAAQTVFASPGQVLSTGDRWASFLKIFAGEVLGAFERMTKTMDKHIIRTISNGKSASFPVMGRATAKYLSLVRTLMTSVLRLNTMRRSSRLMVC